MVKKKKNARTSAAEKAKRISLIYRLLVNGMRRRQVLQYVTEETDWGVSESMTDKYIREATDIIKEVTDEEIKASRGMALKRLDDLFYNARGERDYKTALAVQKEMNELFGLKITKVEHSGSMGVTVIDDINKNKAE